MSNQKYDAVWVEGSFFEKGHWKLIPKSGDSGLGTLIMFFLLIIVLCIVILVSPLIIVLIGFSIVKHKRYYASIVSILAMIYLFIDYQKKWITSFIIFGSNGNDGKFSDGIIGIKYAPHFFFVNSVALTIAVYFLFSSYYINSNRTNENILNIKPNQKIISFSISLVFGLVSFFYMKQIKHEFQKNEIVSHQIDSTSSNEYSKDNINDIGYEYSNENTETEPEIVNDSSDVDNSEINEVENQLTNNENTVINIPSIVIENQVWSSQNLDVDKFTNGDLITQAKNDKEWIECFDKKKPCWCYFLFDYTNKKYGKIYNWYAVFDPRGLAPKDWQIPNQKDWNNLIDFLGGEDFAGNKIKNIKGFNAKITGELEYQSHWTEVTHATDRTIWWSSDITDSFYIKGNSTLHQITQGRLIIEGTNYLTSEGLGEGDGGYIRLIKK